MKRTERVGRRSLEYEAVVRKEDGSLGRQQGRTTHGARGFLSAVCYKVHPHAIHHKLLTGEQRWSQKLGLESERQNEKNKVETETGKAKSVYFMNALLKYEIHTTLYCKHAECFKRLGTGGN